MDTSTGRRSAPARLPKIITLRQRSARIAAATLLLMLSTVGIQMPAKQVSADIGPATIYAQGGALQTTSSTEVAMEYEKVTLTYGQPVEQKYQGYVVNGYMPVHVSAEFRMKNTGSSNEKLNIYFPLSDYLYVGGYSEDTSNITNFKVNGNELPLSSITNVPTTINGKTQSMPVYEWPQTFNAGSTTNISVEYDTKSGEDVEVFYLTYVLGTGRGWKGPIGSGEIKFVLPQTLTNYSVVSKAPKIQENKIPYRISGNSIIVPLSNYEPEADDVIALGVYNQGIVSEIEQLKKQPATYANTLSIAKLFRGLSIGPHCAFCVDPAAQQAQNYYVSALDKASSKDELNAVLASYAYGGSSQDPGLDKIFEYMALATDKECDLEKYQCTTTEKDYLLFEMRDMALTKGSSNKYTKEFLTKYSCKIRAYDQATATTVDTFLGGPSDCTVKKTAPTPTTSKKDTTAKKQDNNKKYLIIGAVAAVLLIAGITTFLIIRKKRHGSGKSDQAKKPEDETTHKEHKG